LLLLLGIRGGNVVITILLEGIATVDARVNASQRSKSSTTSLTLRGCLVRCKRSSFTGRASTYWRPLNNSITHGRGWLPPIEGNAQELSHIKNALSYQTLQNRLQFLQLRVPRVVIPTDNVDPIVWLHVKILSNIVHDKGFPDISAQLI